ncbi:UDP-galactopyranose mutase [Ferrimonas marina]|uniref:UDP-galactopyranose mutase n=1 Tax=Ferrimonas marina TaxID=299255 RepID=A0A1M5VJH9_9GAMM|nr:UDP-galactopyranose mutase [Ferrimonas marina]SHH75367.1 UDP-galactopyranose mutase [Ferrimonas marina]
MPNCKLACVGAGFSNAVIARHLAELGHEVVVFEERSHVAGNCHTERDSETGVMVHSYGPHIFHTDDEEVWDYVQRWGTFKPYVNRVKATTQGAVYSLPINLHTINQFFGTTLSPAEARRFLAAKADDSIGEPQSFEEQALRFVGRELYEAFFKGYTLKQWGRSPTELPASILKRLPVRFNYDDNYFSHRFQGIPEEGYTILVERILTHPNIEVRLESRFDPGMASTFDHIFYSGPIDSFFENRFGRLGYRTLDFHRETHDGDYQGCAVMNYGDEAVDYTRITEHKHFAPWESHEKTTVYREVSREHQPGDVPYYPVRLLKEQNALAEYVKLARGSRGVSFVGRLGTYRYLDMDVTIREALDAARQAAHHLAEGTPIPAFFVEPLK